MTETRGPDGPDKEKLEILAQEAEANPSGDPKLSDLRGIGKEIAEPEAPPVARIGPGGRRPGAGRPAGSKTKNKTARAAAPQEKAPIVPLEILRAAIQAPYAGMAALWGPHWVLTDEEADRMVPAHLAVAEQYLPAVLEKHVALYTVGLLHLFSLFARTQIHFRLKAEQEEKAATARRESIAIREAEPSPGSPPKAPPPGPAAFRSKVKPGPRENPPDV